MHVLLNENWLLARDPENRGREWKWQDGIVEGARPAPVPGIVQQMFPAHHGVAWYWLAFTPPVMSSANERALLRFGAVEYLAEVWLNGRSAGGQAARGRTPCASPSGTTIHLTAGQRYRLSAWVKTALSDGAATIRAEEWLFSGANQLAKHETASLRGTSEDWRELSVEFTAHPKAHGVSVILEAHGVGEAWFDDILLEKLPLR